MPSSRRCSSRRGTSRRCSSRRCSSRLGRLAGRWAALSATQRWTLALTTLLLPAVPLGLRIVGYRRLLQLVEAFAPARPDGGAEDDLARARQTASAVATVVRRWPVAVSCLTRSLLLHSLLRWSGLPSTICIGVRKEAQPARQEQEAGIGAEPLLGHAWVELEQVVLNDVPDVAQHYGRLRPLGQPPPASGSR